MLESPQETKVEKKVEFDIKELNLSPSETEVLNLLTEEFMTVKQIALRRHCTEQAVYKIIRKLRSKGSFNIGLKKVEGIRPTYQPSSKFYRIRLHGQEWNIKIIWQDHRYQKQLNNSNTLYLDSNTIRLYKDSIEIYSGHSFYGENADLAEKKSLIYWQSFFNRLEHELNVILIKERSRNIKIVNQHYASVDSKICESSIEAGERIRIYSVEDGKLRYITDDSFGLKEDEAVHPKTAKQDRKQIDKHISDILNNSPPTNSELFAYIQSMALATKELPVVLNGLKEQIASHLALIQEYREENREWRKKKEKELKELHSQTKLGSFGI